MNLSSTKIYSKLMLNGVCFAFAFACTDDPEPQLEPQVIQFEDPLLLQQVKLALDLNQNQEVNEENILLLEELNIDGGSDFDGTISEISSLVGLENATNLNYLHFGNTKITDLTPIRDLEKIEYLRMNNTGVTDLSPIANYTALTYFNANTTRGITDISPLSGNAALQEMILREVPMGNNGLETIRNFPVLYRLNMRNTGVTDVSVLAEIMEAGALQNNTPGASENGGATLDLRGLEVADWSPIEPYLSNVGNLDGGPSN